MMTKRSAKSIAAKALIESRWKRTTAAERKEATKAASAARWPKCVMCGEREGHEVHDYAANVEYRHAYIAPFVAVKKKV